MSKIYGTILPNTRTWTPGGAGSASLFTDPQGFLTITKDTAANVSEITTFATAGSELGNTNSVLMALQMSLFIDAVSGGGDPQVGLYVKDTSDRYACAALGMAGNGRFEYAEQYLLQTSTSERSRRTSEYLSTATPTIWLRLRWDEVSGSEFNIGCDIGVTKDKMFAIANADLDLRNFDTFGDVDEVGIFVYGTNADNTFITANIWHFEVTGASPTVL